MYHAFVKRCKTFSGLDFYAHMVEDSSESSARKRVMLDKGCGIIEEIVSVGSGDNPEELYEKACKKANKLSTEKAVKPKVVEEEKVLQTVGDTFE